MRFTTAQVEDFAEALSSGDTCTFTNTTTHSALQRLTWNVGNLLSGAEMTLMFPAAVVSNARSGSTIAFDANASAIGGIRAAAGQATQRTGAVNGRTLDWEGLGLGLGSSAEPLKRS